MLIARLTFRLIYRPISLIYFLPFCQFIKCCSRLVVQQLSLDAVQAPLHSLLKHLLEWSVECPSTNWIKIYLQQGEASLLDSNKCFHSSTQNCSQSKCRLLTDNFSASPSSDKTRPGRDINHVENKTPTNLLNTNINTNIYYIYQNPIFSSVLSLVGRILIIQPRL